MDYKVITPQFIAGVTVALIPSEPFQRFLFEKRSYGKPLKRFQDTVNTLSPALKRGVMN